MLNSQMIILESINDSLIEGRFSDAKDKVKEKIDDVNYRVGARLHTNPITRNVMNEVSTMSPHSMASSYPFVGEVATGAARALHGEYGIAKKFKKRYKDIQDNIKSRLKNK